MLPELEDYAAEFAEYTDLTSHPDEPDDGGAIMDFDVKREREVHRAELRRLLAEPAARVIRQGIAAYSRDLPRLLAEGHAERVIAYRGRKCLGIADTRELLLTELAKDEIFEDDPDLYINTVTDHRSRADRPSSGRTR